MTDIRNLVFAWRYLLQLQSDAEAPCPCLTSGSLISDYNWGERRSKTRALSAQTLQIWGQFRSLIASIFVAVMLGEGETKWESLPSPASSSSADEQAPTPDLPDGFLPPRHTLRSFYSSAFPSSPICAPLPPLGPGPLPALSLTPTPSPCSQITSSRVSR